MYRYLILAILMVFAPLMQAAFAYQLSPIVAQFAPKGPGASRTFVITNTHAEPIALQIEMFRRSADPTGKETREPEYDDFIVTPPQMVIAPGQSQSIRAQWVGDGAPEKELSYRLVVTQLPIKFAKESSGEGVNVDVSMGYKYEAAVYVSPVSGKPSAQIIKSEAAIDATGQRVLRVTVQSTGERRAILVDPTLTISAGGQTVQLSGEDILPFNNRNLIAGSQAILDVPWPASLPFGPVSTSLDTKYFSQ